MDVRVTWEHDDLINVVFPDGQADAVVGRIMSTAMSDVVGITNRRYEYAVSGAMRWEWSQEAPLWVRHSLISEVYQ